MSEQNFCANISVNLIIISFSERNKALVERYLVEIQERIDEIQGHQLPDVVIRRPDGAVNNDVVIRHPDGAVNDVVVRSPDEVIEETEDEEIINIDDDIVGDEGQPLQHNAVNHDVVVRPPDGVFEDVEEIIHIDDDNDPNLFGGAGSDDAQDQDPNPPDPDPHFENLVPQDPDIAGHDPVAEPDPDPDPDSDPDQDLDGKSIIKCCQPTAIASQLFSK